jgi:hypothetical protein
MLKATIVLTGNNVDELVFALKAVKRQVEEGFTSGKQNTMDNSFFFSIEGNEVEDES